jgi:hypothetical protein
MMTLLCQPVGALDEAGRAQHHQAVRLMNHIHVVDRIFIAHLTGQAHTYTATNTPDTPTPTATVMGHGRHRCVAAGTYRHGYT